MFSSLRFRLWLTYALLVVTAVSVVAIALVVYLIRNPLSYRQTLERVTAAQKLISNRPVQLIENNNADFLNTVAESFDVRVTIYSSDGSRIVRDTLPGTDRLLLPTSETARKKLPVTRDSKGRVWLYSETALQNGDIMLVAALRPRLVALSLFTDELLPFFLEGGAIALLLSLGLAFLIARWVADPLQSMLAAAREVPEGATAPVRPAGPREVQDVMRAFNSMVARVHASQSSQREFVANVSHELKTPLTSIQGFAQAILDGTAETLEARQQAAQAILSESSRMHRMALDLLDLARLDSGTADLQMGRVDVSLLLHGVAEKFAPLAQKAVVTISVEAENLPSIIGDGDRLAQVFTNLLDNALKFTPSGGSAILGAHRAGNMVEISVKDTGVGIAPEALPHVFDRFYQGDASRARNDRQGAGLGLAIAREIVGAHGGKISVQSQPGQGTNFIVALPLA